MLALFDFVVSQLRYVKSAMDEIPSFRPDGLSPVEVEGLIEGAGPVRGLFLEAKSGLDEARALRKGVFDRLHGACVDFGQQAGSTFRGDELVMDCLRRLPTNDRTLQERLVRAEAILAQWEQLPEVGTPLEVFAVRQGEETLTLAGMTALHAAAEAAEAVIPVAAQEMKLQRARLHGKLRELKDVVVAALKVGRSQFSEGRPERGLISAVPKVAVQKKPGEAVVKSAVNAAPGVVRLDFFCERATSFEVLMKAAGAADYEVVAEGVKEGFFELKGLAPSVPPGRYGFAVRGRNSRGLGKVSAAVSLGVT